MHVFQVCVQINVNFIYTGLEKVLIIVVSIFMHDLPLCNCVVLLSIHKIIIKVTITGMVI